MTCHKVRQISYIWVIGPLEVFKPIRLKKRPKKNQRGEGVLWHGHVLTRIDPEGNMKNWEGLSLASGKLLKNPPSLIKDWVGYQDPMRE